MDPPRTSCGILAGELDIVSPADTFRWHRVSGFPRDEVQAEFRAKTDRVARLRRGGRHSFAAIPPPLPV